jgi:hypothetical protein
LNSFSGNTGRNRYLICSVRVHLDVKIQHGGLSRIDSAMRQELVDLAMVRDGQSR